MLSNEGPPSASERRVAVRPVHSRAASEAWHSEADHVRLHTKEHLSQRFTLDDGSEVKASSTTVYLMKALISHGS